jgi:glycosyltransferase involved in cell wall biosynthesis
MTSPTSGRESLPLSLLEAAACGRAMVATDVPGCRDIVIAGEAGLLVPLDNPDALADAIERLAARSAIACQIRERGTLPRYRTLLGRDYRPTDCSPLSRVAVGGRPQTLKPDDEE